MFPQAQRGQKHLKEEDAAHEPPLVGPCPGPPCCGGGGFRAISTNCSGVGVPGPGHEATRAARPGSRHAWPFSVPPLAATPASSLPMRTAAGMWGARAPQNTESPAHTPPKSHLVSDLAHGITPDDDEPGDDGRVLLESRRLVFLPCAGPQHVPPAGARGTGLGAEPSRDDHAPWPHSSS